LERRLAAILAADVVGYSRLMGEDEAGTLERLKSLRRELVQPKITERKGRIVKLMGDGLLAEFPSVVEAVQCAIDIQQEVTEREPGISDDRRIRLRIGINLGDIIAEGSDIYGDGVNVAARLEALADPGGICVSGTVFDSVKGKVSLEFSDQGEQQVKNIDEPVQVYQISLDSGVDASAPVLELPDKPSVAVLPFTNMSGDPAQEYFSDGITEDIIISLSYVPWLFVVARNSSFTYKELAVDVREIGRQLGVRYVLEGSVRRAGSRLRVSGQLIDAESRDHLWAARYDGAIEDLFDLQDRITNDVVNAIAPEIRSAEIARAGRKRPDSLDAYDHYLKAIAAIHHARIDEAEKHLDEAIRLAPGYAKAKAMRAWCVTLAPWISQYVDPAEVQAAGTAAEEVLETLDTDPEDEAYAGYVLAFSGKDPARGLRLVERAIERCPSFAWAWESSAMMHAYRGDSEKAVERARHALRLSPNDPMAFRSHMALGFAQIAAGNFAEALTSAQHGKELNPRMLLFLRFEMVALAHMGRLDEAREVCARHMEMAPGFRVRNYIDASKHLRTFLSDKVRLPMIEGLRLAGMPE
jgi:adenylate cyclase